MSNKLTLNDFIEVALDYDWELESVKNEGPEKSRLIMTLKAQYGDIILQFDAVNFSNETQVIVYRRRNIIMKEKAGNIDFCVGSIAIKFDDEGY